MPAALGHCELSVLLKLHYVLQGHARLSWQGSYETLGSTALGESVFAADSFQSHVDANFFMVDLMLKRGELFLKALDDVLRLMVADGRVSFIAFAIRESIDELACCRYLSLGYAAV